ncbi:hypothetical protein GCM10022631_11130 [Deinococcus rubellus]|uniref:hypothetical protein n=1 Tax=Deinococcus rubellus TaxID=1889240 RepID=UPI0031E976F9
MIAAAPLEDFKRELLALTRRLDLPLPSPVPEDVAALKDRAAAFLHDVQGLPFFDPLCRPAHLIISPRTLVGLTWLGPAIPGHLGVEFDPVPGTLGLISPVRILGCPVHVDAVPGEDDLCVVTVPEAQAFEQFLRAGQTPRAAAVAAHRAAEHSKQVDELLAWRFGRAVPR